MDATRQYIIDEVGSKKDPKKGSAKEDDNSDDDDSDEPGHWQPLDLRNDQPRLAGSYICIMITDLHPLQYRGGFWGVGGGGVLWVL